MALVRGACTLLCIVFQICLARLLSTDLVFISAQCCDPKSVIRQKNPLPVRAQIWLSTSGKYHCSVPQVTGQAKSRGREIVP